MVLADLTASSMNSDTKLQSKLSAINILCAVPQKLMTAQYGVFASSTYYCITSCQVIQDCLGFRILRSGLGTPSTGFRINFKWNLDSGFQLLSGIRSTSAVFRIPKPRRPDSTCKNFSHSGIRITWNDFNEKKAAVPNFPERLIRSKLK